MQNFQLTFNQLIVYSIIANIVLSFLFGLFPLFVGIKMNNRKYGMIGFVAAIVGGAILGVFLSFPIAFIFTWLIMKNVPVADSGEIVEVRKVPAETESSDTDNV